MNSDLFSPVTMGNIKLANRMVMAPMTRNRADEHNAPHDLNATYYQQRATAGLIITEASQVSAQGVGYPGTPGIYSDEQVVGWRKITDAVHAEGGHIFIQLWYCGRISHPDLLPGNQTPVAPSAIRPEGEVVTPEGAKAFVTPRALEADEIAGIVAQYKHAAGMAKQAGFDGIEVHAANGYLIDQFLRDGSNRRTDQYGDSVENRMRFLNEVLDAVMEVWPSHQVGIRLTPENSFNSMSDSDPLEHFRYFISRLNERNLAYLHILEGDMITKSANIDYRILRDSYNGLYIANNGYDKARAEVSLSKGDSDLIAFGVPFLANPDLVYRYQHDLPLNEANLDTFYGGGAQGYTDYPALQQTTPEPG
ncbi:MAG: alkene reductase [Candidatus Thiodiazotropha sp. (ex Dulcina madagascariensis)]|nr:alkene reductase [Candidatus Thiodiazotropha sp. (ex Dulcina madagascariensis)]MCU7927415.1 alkene reductase [Candidatus Thiodiazotropha sp. (ex Dulcina madagascariensis)]